MQTFLIITTVRNGEALVERTLRSICSQAQWYPGPAITYHVQDANSTDATIQIIRRWEPRFREVGIKFSLASEADLGMYDGLKRGFQRFQDQDFDIYCYINAGDMYAPKAFRAASMFIQRGFDWITGLSVLYNDDEEIIGAKLPGPFARLTLRYGCHGIYLPSVQQESTFWGRGAHRTIDFEDVARYRLAGDAIMWAHIAERYDLHVVRRWLGGFTIHEGQQSVIHAKSYRKELRNWVGAARVIVGLPLSLVWAPFMLLPDRCRLSWSRTKGYYVG